MGIPKGVVNVVTGDGPDAGAPLVAHPDVNKIAFTGSQAVGKLIMKSAADTLKRVTLELGGKSPNIFFADSDFENAVDGALFGCFVNQGEVCSAGSRVLVERSIYKKFVDAAAEKAKKIRVGPGMDRQYNMGPLVSKEQYDRVVGYQAVGKREAKVAAGGGQVSSYGKGFYVEPTIFYDVDNAARIAREEIFGPVMSVIPFTDEADALRIANDSSYGLAAAVWTPRHLQGDAGGEESRSRHHLGEPHAADLRRSTVGRLQDVRLRPRAGQVGRGRVPGDEAGLHQPRRETDRLVHMTYRRALLCAIALVAAACNRPAPVRQRGGGFAGRRHDRRIHGGLECP